MRKCQTRWKRDLQLLSLAVSLLFKMFWKVLHIFAIYIIKIDVNNKKDFFPKLNTTWSHFCIKVKIHINLHISMHKQIRLEKKASQIIGFFKKSKIFQTSHRSVIIMKTRTRAGRPVSFSLLFPSLAPRLTLKQVSAYVGLPGHKWLWMEFRVSLNLVKKSLQCFLWLCHHRCYRYFHITLNYWRYFIIPLWLTITLK